jgi:hypothetical protein
VQELIDLQLLVFELFVAAGELRGPTAKFSIALGELCDERRVQITQFFCVPFSKSARQHHGH